MILLIMSTVVDIVAEMRNNPKGIRFTDAVMVCNHYFGNPRVNIQNEKGKAKAYQVRQILAAIDKLEDAHAKENR